LTEIIALYIVFGIINVLCVSRSVKNHFSKWLKSVNF